MRDGLTVDAFEKMLESAKLVKGTCKCKGLIYRYREKHFRAKNGHIVWEQRVYPLKKMSCPGCPECEWMKDSIPDTLWATGLSVREPKDGGVYKLTVTHTSTDYETGHIDDWDLEFLPVDEG